MSKQLDFIVLHQAVVTNEQQPTTYTNEVMKQEIAMFAIQYGKEETDRIVKAGKLYSKKHPVS